MVALVLSSSLNDYIQCDLQAPEHTVIRWLGIPVSERLEGRHRQLHVTGACNIAVNAVKQKIMESSSIKIKSVLLYLFRCRVVFLWLSYS
jgi:hypothetical protein